MPQDRLESGKPWEELQFPAHSVLRVTFLSQPFPPRHHPHPSPCPLLTLTHSVHQLRSQATALPACLLPLHPTRLPTPHQSLLLQQKVSLFLLFPVLILQVLQPGVGKREEGFVRFWRHLNGCPTARCWGLEEQPRGPRAWSTPSSHLFSISSLMSMPCCSSSSFWAKFQSTGSEGGPGGGGTPRSRSSRACSG